MQVAFKLRVNQSNLRVDTSVTPAAQKLTGVPLLKLQITSYKSMKALQNDESISSWH